MQFKRLPKALVFVVALFLFVMTGFTAEKAYAVSANDISVDIVPPNPAPHENTTITLSSYAANLDSVLITWSVNGKVVTSGVGTKSFSLDSGAQGVATRVDARISLPDGELSKHVTITPSVLVLLWQATDSYVPPFYKGKALLSEGSEVKIVAMPEVKSGITTINPKNLTYSWQKDYTNEPNANGYGKNAFTFDTDYLDKSNTISVEATTIDQRYSSGGNITTVATIPQISFYRRDGSLGTKWEESLSDNYTIAGSSGTETIIAVPYYISPKNIIDPTLKFTWHINDQIIIPKSNYTKHIMPLRVEGGVSGSAKLRLDIENTDRIFQTAMKEITVNF